MGLQEYRVSSSEVERTDDLLRLVPCEGSRALDVGARDGHFSRLLSARYESVFALDLAKPVIDHPRVTCVEGDVTKLSFSSESFDLVFCTEVLEHIPEASLELACRELQRVSGKYIVIGVPYKQDIRVGRTTCYTCFQVNPPWGHVNVFDEARLTRLFSQSRILKISYVGGIHATTNRLSTFLMDLAGNPYGTYDQEEPCVHCGSALKSPSERSFMQKVLTKCAFWLREATETNSRNRPKWIHVLLDRAPV